MKKSESIKKVLIATLVVLAVLMSHTELRAGDAEVICVPELEDMACAMLADYQEVQPAAAFHIRVVPAAEIEPLTGTSSLVLTGKQGLESHGKEFAFRMVLGRQVLVPVISSRNPFKEQILERGISREAFRSVYSEEGSNWGIVAGTGSRAKVHALMPGKTCQDNYLRDYLGGAELDASLPVVDDPAQMAERIAQDPHALGFCSLACLKALEEKGGMEDLCLVPIDMNANGEADFPEQIYSCCQDLSHGIYLGKYPRELYGRMYALAQEKPVEGEVFAFLTWALGDGQQTLAAAGILPLDASEQLAAVNKMQSLPVSLDGGSDEDQAGVAGFWFLAGAFLILAALLILVVSRFLGRKPGGEDETAGPVKTGEGDAYPAGYFFDASHTWTFMEKEGNVRIGMDAFLRDMCGPLSRVIITETGSRVRKGDPLVTLVQDGKKLVLASPISGRVLEQNAQLGEEISLLNEVPYGEGWICRVQPLNWMAEMKTFLMGEPVKIWLKDEMERMKALFAKGSPVLQDGGEVRKGILKDMGPEAWEEFQAGFLNK